MLTSVPKSRKCWDLEFRDSPILTLFLFRNNVFARFILTIVADDILRPYTSANTTPAVLMARTTNIFVYVGGLFNVSTAIRFILQLFFTAIVLSFAS